MSHRTEIYQMASRNRVNSLKLDILIHVDRFDIYLQTPKSMTGGELIKKLSLSHWYPGSGIALNCIDS